MSTLKLKKRPAGTISPFANTLPNNHFFPESLNPRGPKACSSTDIFKQAKSIQTLPPPYQTKSSSVKTKMISLPKPSKLDQARIEASSLKNDPAEADTALKRLDVAGTEVARGLGVMGRLSRSLRATVTGAYTLSQRPSWSTRFFRSSRACALAMLTLFIAPVLGVPIEPGGLSAVDAIPTSLTGRLITANPKSTDPNQPPLPEWSFPILCSFILATCLLVAKLKRWEPSHVSGTLAATSWWLWLYLKRDPHISPWFSWTVWGMGAITTTYYSHLGFQSNELFLSFLSTIPLALAAVKWIPDLQSDHLTAFPPCFNLSLAFRIFAVPLVSRVWGALSHHTCHLWAFGGRHTRRVIRRLRVPWYPEDELPQHRHD